MNKFIYIIIFLLFTIFNSVVAQRNVISSGNSITGGNKKVSYSVGQAFYQHYQSSTGKLNEGLQQPNISPSPLFSHVIPTYLGSSGASISSLNRKLSYSIGQPFYTFKASNSGKVRDGVQQPLLAPIMMSLHLNIQGFYQGSGTLAAVLSGEISDSIQVELHDAISPSSIIYSKTTLLSVLGNASVIIPPALRGNYFYVVIRHRNSIETWSKLPIQMTASTVFNLKSN